MIELSVEACAHDAYPCECISIFRHKTISSSLSQTLCLRAMSGEWVSGDFNLDDVKKAVNNLKVFPIDMHSFHESSSGPLTSFSKIKGDTPCDL